MIKHVKTNHLATDDYLAKIIIAGTGRAGTSFLVQLLTRLKFDTGFTPENDGFDDKIRAGCEYGWPGYPQGPSHDWLMQTPLIIKCPQWSFALKNALKSGMKIHHVFIPTRDLTLAAESRIVNGLVWGVIEIEKQECYLAEALGRLTETIITFDIPHTFLIFPKLVKDVQYCFDKLSCGLDGIHEIGFEQFQSVYSDLVYT